MAVRECMICEKQAQFTCEKCRRVYYCGREHQEADWKVHKIACDARIPTSELLQSVRKPSEEEWLVLPDKDNVVDFLLPMSTGSGRHPETIVAPAEDDVNPALSLAAAAEQKEEGPVGVQIVVRPPACTRTEERLSPAKGFIYLDSYAKIKDIGSGGYGTIELRKWSPTAEVVVKNQDADRSLSYIYEFVSEVARHPNLVRYCKAGFSKLSAGSIETPRMSFFMDTASCSLSDYIYGSKAIEPLMCLSLAYQIVRAVEYLHRNLITHGDLKPGNILLFGNPTLYPTNIRAVLADFGLSVPYSQETVYETRGTPLYCAPEICINATVLPKSDMWSVGCTLFEMVARRDLASVTNTAWQVGIWLSTFDYMHEVFDVIHPVNEGLESLLSRLLVTDHDTRASAFEALHHPYFASSAIPKIMVETYIPAPQNPNPPQALEGLLLRSSRVLQASDVDSAKYAELTTTLWEFLNLAIDHETVVVTCLVLKILVDSYTAKLRKIDRTDFYMACLILAREYRCVARTKFTGMAEPQLSSVKYRIRKILQKLDFNLHEPTVADLLRAEMESISDNVAKLIAIQLCLLLCSQRVTYAIFPARVAKYIIYRVLPDLPTAERFAREEEFFVWYLDRVLIKSIDELNDAKKPEKIYNICHKDLGGEIIKEIYARAVANSAKPAPLQRSTFTAVPVLSARLPKAPPSTLKSYIPTAAAAAAAPSAGSPQGAAPTTLKRYAPAAAVPAVITPIHPADLEMAAKRLETTVSRAAKVAPAAQHSYFSQPPRHLKPRKAIIPPAAGEPSQQPKKPIWRY